MRQVVGRVWRWNDSDNPLRTGHETGIAIVAERVCLVKPAFRFGTAVVILDRIHPTLLADPSPCGTAWGSCNPGRPLS